MSVESPGPRLRHQLPLLIWLVVVWILLWGTWSWANLLSGLAIALVVMIVLPLPPAPADDTAGDAEGVADASQSDDGTGADDSAGGDSAGDEGASDGAAPSLEKPSTPSADAGPAMLSFVAPAEPPAPVVPFGNLRGSAQLARWLER